MKFNTVLLLFLFYSSFLFAQKKAIIEGTLFDDVSNEKLVAASIVAIGKKIYTTNTDENGAFRLEVEPDLYNIKVSFVGYETFVKHEVEATTSLPVRFESKLKSSNETLSETVCQVEAFAATKESPAALYKFNQYEVMRLPGATMDISKYVKSLPGVNPRVSFGYNMIVRGGAAFENKFYLDGIEIPTITHFNVAGTSGGPNGLINTKLLDQATLHSGAFPVARPNALSSVLEMRQREGRKDRFGGNFTVGASDWGFLLEGPMGKKSTYVFSARESYAQHALKALGVPVIPTYADAEYKQVFNFNENNKLTFLALGLYDKYELNYGADTNATRLYNIGFIPEGKQYLYVLGLNYRNISKNGYNEIVLSRNGFFNKANKFKGNSYKEADRLLDFFSKETETKFRLEKKIYTKKGEWTSGINAEYDQIAYDNLSYFFYQNTILKNDYKSNIDILRYGLYSSFSSSLMNERLTWAASLRLDGNNYNKAMSNPLSHLSPRLSMSYVVNPNLKLSSNWGIYYQTPAYATLLYQQNGQLVNQDNLKQIRSNQVTLSAEHSNEKGYQIKVEGFYKKYSNYVFLLDEGISIANANASYVAIGMQNADSRGRGRAYGVEMQARQKFLKSYYWMAQYSYIVSQFADSNDKLVVSAWDNRHLINLSLGKTLDKGWQIGARWSASDGAPYTPYQTDYSTKKQVWDLSNRGIFDYKQLNTSKLPFFHQLDVRIDKQFNFRKKTLTTYIDVANAYKSKLSNIPYLSVERDARWRAVEKDAGSYRPLILNSDTGRILYTLGIIFDM